MKANFYFALASLLIFVIVGFTIIRTNEIPKVWDIEQLESMHLPYPDTSVDLGFISEEYYNQLPERISYKTYPFYMPGSEPKGYYDSLSKLEPVENFKQKDLKTEADWIKAGKLIYELPQNFIRLDSAMLANLPAIAKKWQATDIHANRKGIIPFVVISIRKKGTLEIGTFSCGMCHTKQMPDDQLFDGAQGNFVGDRFGNILAISNPNFEKLTPDNKLKVFHNFNQRLYHTPWIKNDYQENYKKVKAEDIGTSYYGILPGVQSRNNASFDHPISIPDLYNLKDRKYLDKSGHNLNRGIEDIMRYATLNQTLNMMNSYGDFMPDPRPTDPSKYTVGKFSGAQLYALAKFLYSIKTPKNPQKFPAKLLQKGKAIFTEQGCVTCHTPPLYTNNKLTPVDGFEPPASHFKKYDIFDVSVGTDPGLSLYTRRGSGYYKVPSLIGAWNRTAFLHDGHLATLEDMFDSARLSPNYTPTYFKPLGVTQMAVPGHTFGMELKPDDKKALVAFIKSL
jgi:hypothetical protein